MLNKTFFFQDLLRFHHKITLQDNPCLLLNLSNQPCLLVMNASFRENTCWVYKITIHKMYVCAHTCMSLSASSVRYICKYFFLEFSLLYQKMTLYSICKRQPVLTKTGTFTNELDIIKYIKILLLSTSFKRSKFQCQTDIHRTI